MFFFSPEYLGGGVRMEEIYNERRSDNRDKTRGGRGERGRGEAKGNSLRRLECTEKRTFA